MWKALKIAALIIWVSITAWLVNEKVKSQREAQRLKMALRGEMALEAWYLNFITESLKDGDTGTVVRAIDLQIKGLLERRSSIGDCLGYQHFFRAETLNASRDKLKDLQQPLDGKVQAPQLPRRFLIPTAPHKKE